MEIKSLVFLKDKMNGWKDSSYHLMIHQQYLLKKSGYQVILKEDDFFVFDKKERVYFFDFDSFVKELKKTSVLFFLGFLRYPSVGDDYEITIYYNKIKEKHSLIVSEKENRIVLNKYLSDNNGKDIKVCFKINEFASKNKNIYDKTLDIEYDTEAQNIIRKFHPDYQGVEFIIPNFLRDNDFLRTMGNKGMEMTKNNWYRCFSVYLKDKTRIDCLLNDVNYYLKNNKRPILKYDNKLILINPPKNKLLNRFKVFISKIHLTIKFIKFQYHQ